jgi:hypothetical protein
MQVSVVPSSRVDVPQAVTLWSLYDRHLLLLHTTRGSVATLFHLAYMGQCGYYRFNPPSELSNADICLACMQGTPRVSTGGASNPGVVVTAAALSRLADRSTNSSAMDLRQPFLS